MNAYIYQAALLCEDCAFAAQKACRAKGHYSADDSDRWPQGPYADGGGESDSPEHCDHCGIFLENPLTSDGEEYVRLVATPTHAIEKVREWREYYSYLFRDTAEEPAEV